MDLKLQIEKNIFKYCIELVTQYSPRIHFRQIVNYSAKVQQIRKTWKISQNTWRWKEWS